MNRRSLIALGLATALARFFPIGREASRPLVGPSDSWEMIDEAGPEAVLPVRMRVTERECLAFGCSGVPVGHGERLIELPRTQSEAFRAAWESEP